MIYHFDSDCNFDSNLGFACQKQLICGTANLFSLFF